MPHAEKAAMRRHFRRARQSLGRYERRYATGRITRHLCRHIKRGSRIGVYWPIGSELRLDDFVQTALQRGAHVYLPYIEPRSLRLWFTPYVADATQAERRRGRLQIPQFAGNKIRAHRLNLLLLPLVAIDRSGYRLGQGGGYYDVSLTACRHRLQPHKIGVGFACQYHDGQLPHEPHDIRLNGFICEHGWRCFRI